MRPPVHYLSDATDICLIVPHLEVSMYSNDSLPILRFEIIEAARILRMSRATLYDRIRAGELKAQKDGRRRYVTAAELQRNIASRNALYHVCAG